MKIIQKYFPLIISVLFIGLLIWLKSSAPIADFGNYYFGSSLFMDGAAWSDLYDPYSFNRSVQELGASGLFLNFGVFPPITVILGIPLTWFDPFWAKLMLNAFSSLLFLITMIRLLGKLGISKLKGVALLIIFTAPLLSNFYQGQIYILVLVLLVEGWLALEAERYWLSAILWALAAMLKIFPFVLIIYLIWARQYKQIGRAGLAVVFICGISLIIIPLEVWTTYLSDILPKIMAGEFNDPYSMNFQSMGVVLRTLFVEDALLNPAPFLSSSFLFKFLETSWKFVVLFLTWRIMHGANNKWLSFSLLLLFAVVFSGYSTVYSLILLLPLAAFLIQHGFRKHLILLGLLFLAISLKVSWFSALPLVFQAPRLWLSLAVLIGMLVLSNATFSKRYIMYVLIFSAIISMKSIFVSNHTSSLVRLEPTSLLTTGLSAKKEGLMVETFDQHGEHSQFIQMKVDKVDTSSIWVEDHQLVRENGQITSGIDQKRNPILINDSSLFFLSDEGRGPGFFAVRKMTIY